MFEKVMNWYMSRAAVPFWLLGLTDCAIVYIAGIAAYALNHSLSATVGDLHGVLMSMLCFMVCYVIGFRLFHTYSGIIRKTSANDLARVACALFTGSALALVMKLATPVDRLLYHPFRVRDLMMLTFLGASMMCALRMVAKLFYDLYLRHNSCGPYGYANKDLLNMEMSDLLPREPIEINMANIRAFLSGKTVMVTGAAGSIGSELSRLLADTDPAMLLLIDQAETPLHDLRLTMQRLYPHIDCITIVASVCHGKRMERLFSEYRPQVVFHAAAYKHVPMMEDNPVESVLNNVDGTRKLADLAVKYGVEKFVMVSTDKAVNPTNVMGCSKRICEMYCQSLSGAQSTTQFITTRFGNVLGSNGSVIPTFRDQIRRGGPVMVTHPEVIRYFMLIPEACSLVLEAAAMGHGGEIFAFDMGKPVKIVDLARRMIMLSGRLGVTIEYSGLRPGEKLYEEVLTDSEHDIPTSNPKIKCARVRALDMELTRSGVDSLIEIARTYDAAETVRMMKRLVPEYISSSNSPYAALDIVACGIAAQPDSGRSSGQCPQPAA